MKYKVLGVIITSLPLTALLIGCGVMEGWMVALKVFGAVSGFILATSACVLVGVKVFEKS